MILCGLLGCEQDDSTAEPISSLEADAGTIEGVQYVGEAINLDGSKSKDTNGKPFQFSWRFKEVPTDSESELQNKNTAKPSFTPDMEGEYVVELKIYNEASDDIDEITIAVEERDTQPGEETVILDEDILEDTHLVNIFEDDTKIDYLVTKDISVRALLTIDPSVTIAFEAGKGMYIDYPGTIKANGSPEGDVVFTGKTKTSGFWTGLIINSNKDQNLLQWTRVEYAGGYNGRGMDVPASVALDNESFSILTMSNSTIHASAGYGLLVEPGTTWNANVGNTFSNNHKPMLIAASQLSKIDGLQEFKNNNINVVEVIGNRINSTETSFWSSPQTDSSQFTNSIPYFVRGTIEIASEVHIAEGTRFVMGQDAEINVLPTGSLMAVGTATYPISFTEQIESENGFWRGISITSDSPKNEFKYVEISGAGSEEMEGFTQKAAVALEGSTKASLKLTNSKILSSGGHGLFLENHAHLNSLGFVQFKNNKNSAISLSANAAEIMNHADAVEYLENGHNGVEIFESILSKLGGSETVWPALHFGATYLVSGNLALQSGLKLSPGTVLQMADNAMIGVFGNAYLHAVGNNTSQITFRGKNDVKGSWNGILFQSGSEYNVFSNVNIKNAGKTTMMGVNKVASIGLDGDYLANLYIANCIISNGLGYGIAVEDNRANINADAETANQFEDLDLGNLFQ